MNDLDLLRSIGPTWINRATFELAHGAMLSNNLSEQLTEFHDLLVQAIEQNDYAILNPLLVNWCSSSTETDLASETTTLPDFIHALNLSHNQACRDILPANDALSLIIHLTPLWGYINKTIADQEIKAKVGFVSNQLSQVRQSLKKLDRSKSDFISIAAHELKTPLTLVDGYSAMLRESLEQKNIATSSEYHLIDGISNGTRRLLEIINDMIDVSMIDNNLLSLTYQPVWINHILNILENEMRQAVNDRRLTLTIHKIPDENEPIFGDSERLLQLFKNLLSNAVKYTPDGGKITISNRILPGFIEICFQDTGIGINPDEQVTIFDKFSRLGNSALHSSGKVKFKGGGPGLGLHIAKGIIEAHNGTIWVESLGYDEKTCPGSIFHVLIPNRTSPPDDHSAKLYAHLQLKR